MATGYLISLDLEFAVLWHPKSEIQAEVLFEIGIHMLRKDALVF